MRTALIALAAAGAAAGTLAAPPPAAAQTAAERADVRCILALGVVGRDPKQQQAAAQGVYFFLGRVSGRGSAGKLENVMRQEGAGIKDAAQIQAELNRCSGELRGRTGELQAAYKALQAEAAAAGPPPAPAAAPAPPRK